MLSTREPQPTGMRSRAYLTGAPLVLLARVFLGRAPWDVFCVSETLARGLEEEGQWFPTAVPVENVVGCQGVRGYDTP